MQIQLPATHAALLRVLEADHRTAAAAASSAFPAVAATGLLDTHALAPDLEEAAAVAAGLACYRRQALRALACAAVLRQVTCLACKCTTERVKQ